MKIYNTDESFDYDIRSLVRAFYPGEPVDIIRVMDEEAELVITDDLLKKDKKRTEIKNELKRDIYDKLHQRTGKALPWGTLTGIRPTKLYLRAIRDGKSEKEIHAFMRDNYYISDEKSKLSYQVARREYDILSTLNVLESDSDSYSIYIGIPFCPSICLYCSFSSYPMTVYEDKADEYLKALFKEIDFVSEAFSERSLTSIYVGGGTPTALSADRLERLLSYIEEKLITDDTKEWTVEAGRPDSLNIDKLKCIKRHWNGNIRISINPQSMNDDTLRLIGRAHSTDDIRTAFRMARDVGIETINADIIAGLPGEGIDEIAYTLDEIKRLSPDNLTIHSLAIKRASRLSELMEDYMDKHRAVTADIMKLADDRAADMGMKPYYLYRQKDISGNFENIGYAPFGRECLYNILIMEEIQDIVALGAGAACKRLVRDDRGNIDIDAKVKRCENVKDVDLYISRIDEMIDRKKELWQS